jgi:O-antigen ligase
VGLVALVLLLIRQRATAVRRLVGFGITAAIVMVIGYPWWTGRDLSGVMARQSLHVRAELVKTGLRIIETRPLFGVGIDRFHLLAGSLASADLQALFPARKNPHNDFLRFASELGLVGLGLFLWILARAARRSRRRHPCLSRHQHGEQSADGARGVVRFLDRTRPRSRPLDGCRVLR